MPQHCWTFSVVSHVGNGTNIRFWKDKWLFGSSVGDLAPAVLDVVPAKFIKSRTVSEALHNNSWVSDIKGALSMFGLIEFCRLWDAMQEVFLSSEDDTHSLEIYWFRGVLNKISLQSLLSWLGLF